MPRYRFIDLPLLVLLLSNAWCIWYYEQHPDGFGTLIWVYWCQSAIIGLFNAVYIRQLQNMEAGNFKIGDEPVTIKDKGCLSAFFFIHYGGFHLGYAIFLLVKYHYHIDSQALLYTSAAFFLQSFLSYREKKAYESGHAVNISVLFFLPYLRVIPMHLMIMLPSLLGGPPRLVFLILKTIADVGFYFISRQLFAKNAVKTKADPYKSVE